MGLFQTGSGQGRFLNTEIWHRQGRTVSVAFDESGTHLFAGYPDSGLIRIWPVVSNPPTEIREISVGSSKSLMWAELSADGSHIATVGLNGFFHVIDTDNSRSDAQFPGHEDTIYKARFLPGGHQVATVSTDATVRVWDLDTKSALFTLRLPTDRGPPEPLWDFDLRCTAPGKGIGAGRAEPAPGTAPAAPVAADTCWLVVPLTRGKLAVYDLGPLPADLPP